MNTRSDGVPRPGSSPSVPDEPEAESPDSESDEPLGLDLSAWEAEEPPSGFAEGVVRAVLKKRSENKAMEEAPAPSANSAQRPGEPRSEKRPSLAKAPAKEIPEPSAEHPEPARRRAPGARGR